MKHNDQITHVDRIISQRRRDVIGKMFLCLVTTTAIFPYNNNAIDSNADDLLADFGRSLSTQAKEIDTVSTGSSASNYPYTPSPLPTTSSSALDLSSTPYKKEKNEEQQEENTLGEQIKKLNKEKRIQPRTHG